MSILMLERCDLYLGLLIISIWTSNNQFIAVVVHQFVMFLAGAVKLSAWRKQMWCKVGLKGFIHKGLTLKWRSQRKENKWQVRTYALAHPFTFELLSWSWYAHNVLQFYHISNNLFKNSFVAIGEDDE